MQNDDATINNARIHKMLPNKEWSSRYLLRHVGWILCCGWAAAAAAGGVAWEDSLFAEVMVAVWDILSTLDLLLLLLLFCSNSMLKWEWVEWRCRLYYYYDVVCVQQQWCMYVTGIFKLHCFCNTTCDLISPYISTYNTTLACGTRSLGNGLYEGIQYIFAYLHLFVYFKR